MDAIPAPVLTGHISFEVKSKIESDKSIHLMCLLTNPILCAGDIYRFRKGCLSFSCALPVSEYLDRTPKHRNVSHLKHVNANRRARQNAVDAC
jgi:hypothetical protein